MSPAARMSHSPPSTHEDEPTGTGLQSRSRNARAQARHRAKRKKYIETLEETVKRLQTIVDAAGLDPNAFPPPMPSAHVHSHPYLRELQDDNARLRREADALRVQIAALTAHVSAGSHVTSSLPMHYAPSPPPSDAHTPPPNSERDSKKRRMSAERDHAPFYFIQDSHPQGRTSPASASTSSLATTNSSIHTQTATTSGSSLSMLSPLQQQVVYNSLFSGLGSGANSTPSVSTGSSSQPSHASRPTSPPVPVSTFAQLPATTSLLATSLYPLLTLGIAGGAVSGELGAAAWNAFQQSQLAQQNASNGQQSHSSLAGLSQMGHQTSGLSQNMGQPSLGQGLPGLHNPNPPSFMTHSQPMSTLSSGLESASGLPTAAGLSRMDSPSGLPQSLESMRTSSPNTGSSSPPRFDPSRFESSARFDPPASASRFESSSSLFDPPVNSPHMLTGTPPGFGSSNSSTPGLPVRHIPEARRSSGSSRRDDVL
ncbi:hypothetical protein RHS04_00856 [Rhizoctonia solani]|uniref:BZIP domain-containing protein n=1 Tax=Rhizoctonia solani TaxID=456999 RepID=A0A8H7LNQ2_9AGAM|nr:hypothetical protein RHS04_00856 [Rhizoctonia solani]